MRRSGVRSPSAPPHLEKKKSASSSQLRSRLGRLLHLARATIARHSSFGMVASIQVSQALEASRASIWHAISAPRGIARWQADAASGGLQAGGYVLRWPSLGAELALEVACAEPHRRLVLRNGDTVLELLVEDGRLDLVHHG